MPISGLDYERIAQLERELLDNGHPYGTTPDGLTTEVRVEMEAAWREEGWGWMPPCVERMRLAEAEARRRWPEQFDAS